MISFCTVLYWATALYLNIFKYNFIGVFYEIMAIPFMVLIYLLPILLFLLILRLKKRTPKLHFISLAMLLIMLTLIFFVYQ